MTDRFDVFGPAWTSRFGDALNASRSYATAAASWEGSVVLELDGTSHQAAFLDLHRGACRAARAASDQDLEDAAFLLSADLDTWKQILAGEIDPIFGLMAGKLQLRRGSLAALMPYVHAAKELVACAREVPTRYPNA